VDTTKDRSRADEKIDVTFELLVGNEKGLFESIEIKKSSFYRFLDMAEKEQEKSEKSEQKSNYHLIVYHTCFTECTQGSFDLTKESAESIKNLMVEFKSKRDELKNQFFTIKRESKENRSNFEKNIIEVLRSREKASA
jgi:hypothetical protein